MKERQVYLQQKEQWHGKWTSCDWESSEL